MGTSVQVAVAWGFVLVRFENTARSRRGWARQDQARRAKAQQGEAWVRGLRTVRAALACCNPGSIPGRSALEARLGSAWQGAARRGTARLGMAWALLVLVSGDRFGGLCLVRFGASR